MSKYYVKLGNEKTGPFEFKTLLSMANAGHLKPMDMVSITGTEWKQARFIPDLFQADIPETIEKSARLLPGKISLESLSNPEAFKKTFVFVVGGLLLVGFVVGWGINLPSNLSYSKLQGNFDEIWNENQNLRKEYAGALKKSDYDKALKSEKERYEKILADSNSENQARLKDVNEKLLELQKKHETLIADSKVFADKAMELEKKLEPIKELALKIQENDALKVLLQKLQETPEEELAGNIKEFQKIMANRDMARASELRTTYRTLKNQVSDSFADTLIRWEQITSILASLAKHHKLTNPATTTLEDLKTAKDLQGLFILRTLANDSKKQLLKDLLENSKPNDEKKMAALAALENATKNTLEFLNAIDQDPNLFATTPIFKDVGKAPDLILDEISKALFLVNQQFEMEEPKKIENHLDSIEKVNPKIIEFIFKYSEEIQMDKLGNNLKKYPVYPALNLALEEPEKIAALIEKIPKSKGVFSLLPKEQLMKRLNQLRSDFEIVRISGVFSKKVEKANEN